MIFHVHEVEKFNWRAPRYFISTKWKTFAEELYNISCPRSGNDELKRSMIFHVDELEKFNWRPQ